MMRMRLTLAYDGGGWRGWQIQERALPPPTIQGEVEKALFRLYGRKIRLYGAGRTDSGVHAHAQTAHFDAPRPLRDLRASLNAILPPSIRVLAAEQTRPDFHARKDAVAKTYVYQFWTEAAFTPPQLSPFVWSCGPLRLDAARAALPYLEGRHDFTSFMNSGSDVLDATREIKAISMEAAPCAEFYPPHAQPLRLRVRADGFLKQMVRNIAGALVWIGRGKLAARDLPAILERKSRAALPSPTAPACGLALAAIEYADKT